MQALTLSARHGWRWLSAGFSIFRRKQLLLSFTVLGYWMLMALISALPLIGRMVAMLFIPIFSVGLMNACRLLDQGKPIPLPLLFSGFATNLRPLLVLGVLYLCVNAAVLGLVALIDGGVLFQLVFLGPPQDESLLVSEEVRIGSQLALALFMPLMMAYWYAPVLVAWHGLSAAKSLFFSFVACARNWRAFLVYGVAVVIYGALLPGLVAGLISSLLPGDGRLFSIVLSSLIVFFFLPTLYASFYVSYRDVFVTIDDAA